MKTKWGESRFQFGFRRSGRLGLRDSDRLEHDFSLCRGTGRGHRRHGTPCRRRREACQQTAGRTRRRVKAARQSAKAMSKAFHAAAEQVLPAVVTITNRPTVVQRSRSLKPVPEDGDDGSEEMPFGFKGTPFGDMFKNPSCGSSSRVPRHAHMPARRFRRGSGVIVDPSGIILTNNHVVAGGGKVMVRLHDGREFKAVDIKTDPKTDLAIVRIKAGGTLPAARWATAARWRSAIGCWPSGSRSDWKAPSPPASSAPRAAAWASPIARTSSRPTRPSIPATAAARW